MKVLGSGYAALSILWFVSYRSCFKKQQWTSYYDAGDLELCPDCEGKGYFEVFYTLPGGIIRSLGFGGLVALVMVITDTIWMPIVYGMTLGIIGYFTFGTGWTLVLFAGVLSSYLYYRKNRDKILRR